MRFLLGVILFVEMMLCRSFRLISSTSGSLSSHRLHSMRSLTTPVAIEGKPSFELNHDSKILLLGSCFATNMERKLSERKFNVLSNPSGISFNPISIGTSIINMFNQKEWTHKDLVQDQVNPELVHSWDHHSSFSGYYAEREDVLQRMNAANFRAHSFLTSDQGKEKEKEAVVFITLGTAKVHYLKDKLKVVANCHKQPSSTFENRILNAEEVEKILSSACILLDKMHDNIKICFTVSPVRHTKEGMTTNLLSKSTLICAVHNLITKHPDLNLSYFPAYEMMMDELRDYKYYNEKDLIHPSELAVDIIFDRFAETYLSVDSQALSSDIMQIKRDCDHRLTFHKSEAAQKHLRAIENKILKVTRKNPSLDFSQEREYIRSMTIV